MKGLQHVHRPGEASNYRSPFDKLRANGSLRLSTALFRLNHLKQRPCLFKFFIDCQLIEATLPTQTDLICFKDNIQANRFFPVCRIDDNA